MQEGHPSSRPSPPFGPSPGSFLATLFPFCSFVAGRGFCAVPLFPVRNEPCGEEGAGGDGPKGAGLRGDGGGDGGLGGLALALRGVAEVGEALHERVACPKAVEQLGLVLLHALLKGL